MKQISALLLLTLLFAPAAFANEEEEMAALQRQLNAEVMEKPFSAADEAKVTEYMKDAMAKDLKPEVRKAPNYWRPGYTCANIYSYGWNAYRNCRYYHRYYGRYWY